LVPQFEYCGELCAQNVCFAWGAAYASVILAQLRVAVIAEVDRIVSS
jgi:hypothetical protein